MRVQAIPGRHKRHRDKPPSLQSQRARCRRPLARPRPRRALPPAQRRRLDHNSPSSAHVERVVADSSPRFRSVGTASERTAPGHMQRPRSGDLDVQRDPARSHRRSARRGEQPYEGSRSHPPPEENDATSKPHRRMIARSQNANKTDRPQVRRHWPRPVHPQASSSPPDG